MTYLILGIQSNATVELENDHIPTILNKYFVKISLDNMIAGTRVMQ